MTRAALLSLLALVGTASTASADDATAVTVVHDVSLREPTRQVRRVLRRLSLAPAARIDCDPSEGAPCVRRRLVGTRADRLLVARVAWRRAGCVPGRDSEGRVWSRRMLRRPSVRFELYRDDGTLVASEMHDLRRGADEDAMEEAVAALIERGRALRSADPQSTARR